MEAIMENYTKMERQKHLESWKKGGLSKTAYAKSVGILPTTFYTWTHGYNNRKQGFVEINKKKCCEYYHDIIIEKGNIIIRFPLAIGIEELQKVFAALGAEK
jgi:transposase-like protein